MKKSSSVKLSINPPTKDIKLFEKKIITLDYLLENSYIRPEFFPKNIDSIEPKKLAKYKKNFNETIYNQRIKNIEKIKYDDIFIKFENLEKKKNLILKKKFKIKKLKINNKKNQRVSTRKLNIFGKLNLFNLRNLTKKNSGNKGSSGKKNRTSSRKNNRKSSGNKGSSGKNNRKSSGNKESSGKNYRKNSESSGSIIHKLVHTGGVVDDKNLYHITYDMLMQNVNYFNEVLIDNPGLNIIFFDYGKLNGIHRGFDVICFNITDDTDFKITRDIPINKILHNAVENNIYVDTRDATNINDPDMYFFINRNINLTLYPNVSLDKICFSLNNFERAKIYFTLLTNQINKIPFYREPLKLEEQHNIKDSVHLYTCDWYKNINRYLGNNINFLTNYRAELLINYARIANDIRHPIIPPMPSPATATDNEKIQAIMEKINYCIINLDLYFRKYAVVRTSNTPIHTPPDDLPCLYRGVARYSMPITNNVNLSYISTSTDLRIAKRFSQWSIPGVISYLYQLYIHEIMPFIRVEGNYTNPCYGQEYEIILPRGCIINEIIRYEETPNKFVVIAEVRLNNDYAKHVINGHNSLGIRKYVANPLTENITENIEENIIDDPIPMEIN